MPELSLSPLFFIQLASTSERKERRKLKKLNFSKSFYIRPSKKLAKMHAKKAAVIEKVAVKLGQGGITKNQIAPDAEQRALQTLSHFKEMMDSQGISQHFAFATSAVRNAKNGSEFVYQVKELLGIDIEVISGEEEAQLIYEGIKLSGALTEQTQLMMDIGGGSVEFIIGNSQEVFWKKSFEIGGQRLLDAFHYHDPILSEEVTKLEQYCSEHLQPLLMAIRTFKPQGLVGASGTFDTLIDIYFESMLQCKLSGQHVYELPREVFFKIFQLLITKNREERLLIPGMIPMRVDMIVVASCLIDFILSHLPESPITCSHYSLKEGAISRKLGGQVQI